MPQRKKVATRRAPPFAMLFLFFEKRKRIPLSSLVCLLDAFLFSHAAYARAFQKAGNIKEKRERRQSQCATDIPALWPCPFFFTTARLPFVLSRMGTRIWQKISPLGTEARHPRSGCRMLFSFFLDFLFCRLFGKYGDGFSSSCLQASTRKKTNPPTGMRAKCAHLACGWHDVPWRREPSFCCIERRASGNWRRAPMWVA
nr:hypothetical protein [Pandoravirus massiliensis]